MPVLLRFMMVTASLCLLPHYPAVAATPVELRTVGDVLVDLERRAPAEVLSFSNATLAAEVAAVIQDVAADVGQQVQEGQQLLQLDPTDYELAFRQSQANLESSKAQLVQAEARLTRGRELGQNQYMSADELLARETDVIVLKAQIRAQEVALATARRNLDKCSLEAPFTGVVVERMAQPGAYVVTGTPLFELVETDRIELDAEIPGSLTPSLLQADEIRFESHNESWVLELLRLSPIIDRQFRTQRARFAFTGDVPAVGRTGEVVWSVERGVLPASLMVRRGGVLGIFLHSDGVAVFTPLPGAQEGRPVTVTVPSDAEIVVRGRERLQDGDPIAPES